MINYGALNCQQTFSHFVKRTGRTSERVSPSRSGSPIRPAVARTEQRSSSRGRPRAASARAARAVRTTTREYHGQKAMTSMLADGLRSQAKRSTFFVLVALLSTAGCADYADGVVAIKRLHVAVQSANSQPIAGAAIFLRDLRFSGSSRPTALRSPICISDYSGSCSATIRYSYGYVAWPWSHSIDIAKRFEVEVQKEGRQI